MPHRAFVGTLLLAACASGRGNFYPGPGTSPYDHYVLRAAGSGDLAPCTVQSLGLGETRTIRSFETKLLLTLPPSYTHSYGELRGSFARFLDGQTGTGYVWKPGILVAAGETWIEGRSSGAEYQSVLLQLVHQRGHQPLALRDDWRFGPAEECGTHAGPHPVRVLFFRLEHPSEDPVYGLSAFWLAPTGWVSLLALGADPAFQAEALAIVHQIR